MPFGWVRESNTEQAASSENGTPKPLRSNPILNPFPTPGSPRTGRYVIKQKRGFFGTVWLLIKIAFALFVGFAACYALFHFHILGDVEPPVLTEERKTITVKELESVIEPASDLITSRYRYREADIIESSKELLDWEIPFTQDVEIIRYAGSVGVGFDVADVKFDVSEPKGESDKGSIVVTLPKVRVVQNEIDMESFEVETVQQTPLNPQNIGDATKLLAKIKKAAKKKALADEEFMTSAKNNAELVLGNFLTGANVGAYYDIQFVWEEQS